MRTPMRRVRGLGAARSGTGNFWHQRVTSVAGIPLTIGLLLIITALLGRSHAAVVQILASPIVSIVVLPLLPGVHPRMASEDAGPESHRSLEPPGFLGLNYGRYTPLVTLIAHVAYGAILGGGYRVVGS